MSHYKFSPPTLFPPRTISLLKKLCCLSWGESQSQNFVDGVSECHFTCSAVPYLTVSWYLVLEAPSDLGWIFFFFW